jgi:hypothetical protein
MLHLMNASGRLRVVMIALIVVGSLSLTACKSETNYFADENASEGGGTGGGDAPTTATGFRLRLKAKTGVEGFLHKFGDIAAGCEIPLADKDTPTAINCMLNMMEYDLWFHGFQYEVNVPSGFCEYVEEYPYTYWDALPGAAPVSAAITTFDGVITACTADGVAGTIGGGGATCTVGEGVFTSAGTFKCDYDYTSPGGLGPNCCTGRTNLALTKRTTVIDPPDIETVTSSVEITQAGLSANCIESPMNYLPDDEWPKNNFGIATGVVVELAGNQLTRTQKVPSPFGVFSDDKRNLGYSTAFIAGMHDWSAYATDPATWATNRQRPRPLRPLRDKGPNGNWSSGTPIAAFDGSYLFLCLGPAGELKHRIRLYVNEWNTVEDYQAFKTVGDASAVDPSRRGVSGVDCSAVNTGIGSTCNSFWGFQDIINDPSGANGDATLWYFPDDWRRARPSQ